MSIWHFWPTRSRISPITRICRPRAYKHKLGIGMGGNAIVTGTFEFRDVIAAHFVAITSSLLSYHNRFYRYRFLEWLSPYSARSRFARRLHWSMATLGIYLLYCTYVHSSPSTCCLLLFVSTGQVNVIQRV